MKLALVVLALAVAQPADAPRGTLDGRVLALGSETPVAHATVVVARVGGALEDYRTGTTDADGRFAFRDISPGSYRVHVQRQGFLPGEYGRRTAGGTGIPVVLSASSPSVSIVVSLIQTAVIAGRVLDEGRPVRDAIVRALRSTVRDGARTLAMTAYATTDDLGRYRLYGLPPGTYVVAGAPAAAPRIEGSTYVVPVVPSNANGNRREIRTPLGEVIGSGAVASSAFTDTVFLPVFYPATTDEANAATIQLRAADEVGGIDLPVVRVPTSRISGRVLTAEGAPAAGAQVNVTSVPGVLAGPRGEFELTAVPPGVHRIVSRTTGEYGSETVSVGGEDISGIEIRLRAGTTITGHVTVLDPPPGFPDRDPGRLSVGFIGGPTTTGLRGVGADGAFSIENVQPGEYRLRVFYRREIVPISARHGAADVLTSPVRIDASSAKLPLEIVVTLGTGTVEGRVLNARGEPVAGTVVALVPDAPFRDRSGLYRTAMTDADGRARLDEVPPGEYTVLAGDVEPEDWQDPDRLRAYEARGERLTIRPAGRHAVTLEVLSP